MWGLIALHVHRLMHWLQPKQIDAIDLLIYKSLNIFWQQQSWSMILWVQWLLKGRHLHYRHWSYKSILIITFKWQLRCVSSNLKSTGSRTRFKLWIRKRDHKTFPFFLQNQQAPKCWSIPHNLRLQQLSLSISYKSSSHTGIQVPGINYWQDAVLLYVSSI